MFYLYFLEDNKIYTLYVIQTTVILLKINLNDSNTG
jgi:hypothetical protein